VRGSDPKHVMLPLCGCWQHGATTISLCTAGERDTTRSLLPPTRASWSTPGGGRGWVGPGVAMVVAKPPPGSGQGGKLWKSIAAMPRICSSKPRLFSY
jgi:hypothetical protein